MELKENRECKISVFVDLFYEEGKQYGISIAIKNMLHKGFDIEDIAEMVEVPTEVVRKIKEGIQVDKG